MKEYALRSTFNDRCWKDLIEFRVSEDEGCTLSKFKIFIESGTLFGETIFEMEKYFDELHTVEIHYPTYSSTKSKYSGNKIRFYLGDTTNIFKSLLPNITGNAIFFLDGHWNGPSSGCPLVAKETPLVEEVTSIKELFKYEAVIIIDDYRCFGHNGGSWSTLTKEQLLTILGERVSDCYHLPSQHADNDRLVIHVKSVT